MSSCACSSSTARRASCRFSPSNACWYSSAFCCASTPAARASAASATRRDATWRVRTSATRSRAASSCAVASACSRDACAAARSSNSARASRASASAAIRRSRSSSSCASSAAARPHPDPALLVLERLPPALLTLDSLLPDRPGCEGLSGRAAAVHSANAVSARRRARAGESCCSVLLMLDRLLPDFRGEGLPGRDVALGSANVLSMCSCGEWCCCSEWLRTLVRLVSATRCSSDSIACCFCSLLGAFNGMRNAAEHILFAMRTRSARRVC